MEIFGVDKSFKHRKTRVSVGRMPPVARRVNNSELVPEGACSEWSEIE